MPRIAPGLAALSAALVLIGGCGAAGQPAAPPGTPARAASQERTAGQLTNLSSDEARVLSLFTTRLQGLEAGDLRVWLEGLSGDPLVEQQRQAFERMRALHVSSMRVTRVRAIGVGSGAAERAERRFEVTLAYRFAGFDTSDRRFALEVGVADRPAPASGLVLVASRPGDRPQPWDLPDAHVRRSGSALVISTGAASRVDAVTRDAQAALARVAAVLGKARPAVIVAPDTDEHAAELLGRSVIDLRDVAAVTDGPLSSAGLAGADRVVIVPGAWSTLSPAGRQVVLAHELTHVTTRAAEPQHDTPLWLSEGLAEYVAYRDVRLAEAVIAAPALDEIRYAQVPTRWPTDAQFEPSGGRLSAAYGLALLACRTIVDRHGQQALLRLYRMAATTPIAAAFSASGMTEPTELRAWRARITRLVSRAGQQ